MKLTAARQWPDAMPIQLDAMRRRIANSSGGTSSTKLCSTVLDLIGKLDLRGTVADFGAGRANLIRSLLEMNRFSSIVGLDLMERPSDLPSRVQWCNADLNQPVASAAGSFDLVTSLGLVEYLENPYAFARELHRVLRPDGTAILSTPNNESWRALISFMVRGHFAAFPPLGANINLTALVRSDFERVLRFAGFSGTWFTYSGFGMVPKFPVSWQAISCGLLGGVRYSDDLVVICRKP
jgi:2-polyprenyl-3-methyl-5-hydroxy-6-metoxy-1,4-benzoquinol methylase